MSVYSEKEEERLEELKREEMYVEIYSSKIFLKVYNRKKYDFDFSFPKSSFDKIIELYGKEPILPLSFVVFSNPYEKAETIRYSSRNINVRTSMQINSILDRLSNYYVFPASYEQLDDIEKMKRAPKLKIKYLKDISNKMGLPFSEMINYISLQMTEINVRESMKIVVNVKMYTVVFNLVHLLTVKFPDEESFDIAFYSFKKMMKMAGIEIEQIISYFEILLMDGLTREEINDSGNVYLFEKVLHRELKESINNNIRNNNIDLYGGTQSCDRLTKPDPIILEPYRDEASKLLMKLMDEGGKKLEEKKEEVTTEEENKDNEEKEEEEEEKEETIIQSTINVIDNKEPEIIIEENKDKLNDINININNNLENENKEKEEKNEPDNVNIDIESHMILRNRPQNNDKITNPEENIDKENIIININEPKIIIDDIGNNKEQEKKDEIIINKLDNQKLDNEENENQSLKKNKIIVQSIKIGENEPNDENEDKNKVINLEIENEQNEIIKNDLTILNSKKVLRGKKNLKKNNDKEIVNEVGKNVNNISNNDNINNTKVVNIPKKPKRQFKIRRAVFVKVQKKK